MPFLIFALFLFPSSSPAASFDAWGAALQCIERLDANPFWSRGYSRLSKDFFLLPDGKNIHVFTNSYAGFAELKAQTQEATPIRIKFADPKEDKEIWGYYYFFWGDGNQHYRTKYVAGAPLQTYGEVKPQFSIYPKCLICDNNPVEPKPSTKYETLPIDDSIWKSRVRPELAETSLKVLFSEISKSVSTTERDGGVVTSDSSQYLMTLKICNNAAVVLAPLFGPEPPPHYCRF
jgi:hypothetical protein